MTVPSAGVVSVAGWIARPVAQAAICEAAHQFWAEQNRWHGDRGPFGELDDVEARQLCFRLWSIGVAELFDDDGNRVPIDQAVNAAASMTDWLLPEMWQGHDVWVWAVDAARRLGQLATDVAVSLGAAGLLPTPLRRGDLATIAFTIMRADAIEWTGDPATIADWLQPVEPVEAARTGDGRILPGVRGETRRELDRWLIAVEDWAAGGPPPTRPYARSNPGAQQTNAELRRTALAATANRCPNPSEFEVADLFAGSGRKLEAVAVMFNEELKARGLPEMTRAEMVAKVRTLERDLAKLKADKIL